MADLVVAETTCNGEKKMYELMAESRPVYVLELPQKPDDPDAMGHWGRELAKFRAVLEARFRVSVTDCRFAPGHWPDEPGACTATAVGGTDAVGSAAALGP